MIKKLNIVNIVLFIILLVFIFLITNNLSDSVESKIEIKVDNIVFQKYESHCELSFDVITESDIKLSDNKYDIYLLDKEKNLIYLFDKVSLEFKSNGKEHMNFVIEYDISSFTDILIVVSGEKVSYNKKLFNITNYMGVTTTTTSSGTKVPAPTIDNQINISG